MHRTEQSFDLTGQSVTSSSFSADSALFSAPHHTTQALFAPLHYEPRYAYPLIVWLHGPGDDERQLIRIMPLISMRNYVAVAPRGICLPAHSDADSQGYGWPQSPDGIQQTEQRIFDGIAVASQKYHIASHRIFLAGFASGGTMAFRVALNHPSRFAGVLSFCGAFPQGGTPLRRLDSARRLAVMLAFGQFSREYSPHDACADLRLLHSAGLPVIEVRGYPCEQELMPQMLGDIDRWVMKFIAESRALSSSTQA